MDKLLIPVILGTGREGRQSEKAARFVATEASLFGFDSPLLDVQEFKPQFTDRDKVNESWHNLALKSHGFIIVSPEYNHGYPGELKILLDGLYTEYNRKPVGICGVSSGFLGGARMVEVLRLSLIELQMIPIRNAMYFGNILNLFNESGDIIDESYKERIKIFFEELKWYAEALKNKKEQIN